MHLNNFKWVQKYIDLECYNAEDFCYITIWSRLLPSSLNDQVYAIQHGSGGKVGSDANIYFI